MERFSLDPGLAGEMCARLSVDLPADLAGVEAFYRAWCQAVPFDSISKALARREGRTPPGADPAEVCRTWMATGLGATCWGLVTGMAGVLEVAGVRCRVGLDRFQGHGHDDLVDFHSFLVVEDGERRLALDPVHVSGSPLEMAPDSEGTHPAYSVGFSADEGRLLHWFTRAQEPGVRAPYAVLSTDLDVMDVAAYCEVSSVFGMRALSLYHRRFTPTAMLDACPDEDGHALVLRTTTADGLVDVAVRDPDEAFARLGYGPGAVDVALKAGLVETGAGGAVRWAPRHPD